MKNILTYALLMLFSLSVSGQTSFDEIFEQYEGKKGFSSILITKRMFTLFTQVSDISIEDQNLNDIISGLNGIKILTYEGDDLNTKNDLEQKAKKILTNHSFEELLIVKEEDEEVKILIKESNNTVHELIIFIADKSEVSLISLSGNIDLEKISKLSKALNISGLEYLEGVDAED